MDLIVDQIYKQMGEGEPHVLILPGWQGHSSDHWTGRWPLRHGHQLVAQHDWQRPLRGDWLMRLEETVLALRGPVVLAAHGLGCHLATGWAAHTRQASRVRGALLVAPLDLLSEPWLSRLPSWTKVSRQRLSFPSVVVAQDHVGHGEHSVHWARDWGSRWLDHRRASDFSHGPDADWPEGHALLQELIKD